MWLAVVFMCIAFVLTGVLVVLLNERQLIHAQHPPTTGRQQPPKAAVP